MSEEHPHRLLARSLWSAIAEGDRDAVREMLADDVVWKVHGQHPLAGEYQGPDAALDYLAKLGERVDDLSSTLKRIFVNEDGAVLVHHAVGARGAKRLEVDIMLMLLVRDGQVIVADSVPTDQAASDRFWT